MQSVAGQRPLAGARTVERGADCTTHGEKKDDADCKGSMCISAPLRSAPKLLAAQTAQNLYNGEPVSRTVYRQRLRESRAIHDSGRDTWSRPKARLRYARVNFRIHSPHSIEAAARLPKSLEQGQLGIWHERPAVFPDTSI